MPKNAVFPYMLFTHFVDEPAIKRLSLLFNSIYISENGLDQILKFNPRPDSENTQPLLYEKAVWEFLLENKIIKTYPFFPTKFEDIDQGDEKNYLIDKFKSLIAPPPPGAKKGNIALLSEEERDNLKRRFLEHHFSTHDVMIRLDTLELRKNTDSEFYPILRTNTSFETQEKKSSVIQFLLNDIPEPDIDTSWEQIIEFRSDEDIRNKYLALITWMNKASSSSNSVSDLKDEYEYLYNDYIKHFKLHKLKYNSSILEVLVTAGAGILLALQSGAFIPAFKNLLQMNLSHIKLMEEESKLPGKEVAYIYHARQQFGK